ncbi:amidohydrolase family protein [Thermopolyspora sp. NPDC052614]|uniref:amidohydrolase n=1 Tax=Thermopolyspora sp. NPDC052614 TaxID=3155682 RepID=UPI003421E4D6
MSMDRRGVSRRNILGAGAVAIGGAMAVPGTAVAGVAADPAGRGNGRTTPEGDLILHNGKIRTFDDRDRTVSSVGVAQGRIVGVGQSLGQLKQLVSRDAKVIDLRGRTVIPGMIEAHVHFVSLAIRPGYHVVIENAGDIAGIQALLSARRRDVPEGRFITAMGGWHPNMFAERRLPNLAELDAAVPDRPVLLFQGFSGPAATNSQGKAVLEAAEVPVVVGADGLIAAGANATAALYNVRRTQTFDDKKRSTLDAMAYAASVGITAVQDQVGFPVIGPPAPGQLLSNFDHYRMYDSWLALHREGRTFIRLQMNFLHNQNDINLPELTQRLNNQFQLFGDDLMMTGGIGEWGAPGDGSGPAWTKAQQLIAQAGWRNTNRALNLAQLEAEIAGYEAVNAEYDITKLRWRIDHVPVVTSELLDRLRALGGAVQCGAYSYVAGNGPAAGAPFRAILDHGIKAGIHLDGVHIAPLNPWYGVYYATTGRNALGNLINDGQQISRDEAVRLYTRENAWFLNMEDKLGTIENGKLGDLVVLDRDYRTVRDEDIKKIKPLLTTVGGQIVYDSGELTRRH